MFRFRWPRMLMLLAVLLAVLPATFARVGAEALVDVTSDQGQAVGAPVTDTKAGVTAAAMCGMAAGLAVKGVPYAAQMAGFFCAYMLIDAWLTPDRP